MCIRDRLVNGLQVWSDDTPMTCTSWGVTAAPQSMVHRAYTASATCATGAYLFGGLARKSRQELDDLWLYANSIWKLVTPVSSHRPVGRQGHSLSGSDSLSTILLYGGSSGTTVLGDTWMFDPVSSTWAQAIPTQSPGPLTGHTAISVADKTTIFGGTDGSEAGETNHLWQMTLDSSNVSTWTRISPKNDSQPWPTPRQQHSATLVHRTGASDVMLVYGGCSGPGCSDSCGSSVFGDVWQLDLESLTWVSLYNTSDGPSPRFGHSAVGYGKSGLAVVAGSSCDSGAATEVWLFNSASPSWQQTYNSECVGPAGSGMIRPFLQPLDSRHALFYGNDLVSVEGPPQAPAGWTIDLEPSSCSGQCNGRGVCEQVQGQEWMRCDCYPFPQSQDPRQCQDNNYNFQWYLLYSAFGVTVLLLCFLLRRVYGCIARRNRRMRWAAEGLLDLSSSDAESSWSVDKLDGFCADNGPSKVYKLSDCDICMDSEADLQLLPCEHLLCGTCARRILPSRLECPFCRGEVSTARRLVCDEAIKEEAVSDDGDDQDVELARELLPKSEADAQGSVSEQPGDT
eukprot:TRINITY_DN2324_c0_g1_i1.p1 TRINITY_DN2324_c0_g1~~TRINITY_DN2324_c0_g1_i1.p1  ORF type:complete len:568 (-),score=67.45 TRINITY_DN2324_c0_g1_i1:54-1757(-)